MASKKLQTVTIILMITAICIMSISIVMYNITVDSIKQEVESAYRVSLQNTRERIESYFRSIDQLTLQFEKIPEVVQFTQGNFDPVILGTVLNQAYRLHASLDYVDNVLIYHDEYRESISTNQDMSKRYTEFSPLLEKFEQMNTDKAYIKTELEGIPINVFIRKLPVFSQAQKLTIVFQINQALFDRILGSAANVENSGYFIMDEEGELVTNRGYFSNEEVMKWAGQIHAAGIANGNDSSNVLNLQDTFITYLGPSYNGWSYAYAVSNSSFLHKADDLRNIVLLIAVLLFLLAAVLSFATTQWLWRGWYRIKSLLDNNAAAAPETIHSSNEFKDYLAKVQTIVNRSELLKKQTDEMLPQLKEALSLSLLETGAVSSEVMEKAKQYGILVQEGTYCCLCIINDYPQEEQGMYTAWDKTTLEYGVLLVIKEVIEAHAYGFAVNSQKGHVAAMLSSSQKEPAELTETIVKVTQTIRQFIQQYFPVTVSIGVSKIRTDLSLIKLSYNEALEALNQKHISTGDQVFYSQDAAEPYADEQFPLREIENNLIHAIMTRNEAHAYSLVENLYMLKDKKNIPYKWFQSKMIELTQLLSHQLKQHWKERNIHEPSLDDLLQLATLDEWVNFMKSYFIDGPIDELEKQHQANIMTTTNRLKDYIADHAETDLQLNHVCKALHIPASFAKQALKETMDATFSELVLSMRIEKSKQWLANEDYSIEEIAKRLYYSNAQNFSRTFKKAVGIPPGQYRVNTRADKTGNE
ncbi:helix-turn-helix domain-containing protein [Paenibacillus sp. GXUN7292]|uniref:helix-turn-helix domain-containing protein n=1 Tax=Paenibacillus sp. GXUN7292 TaxID=3422499 RepID=UPI003D7D59C0